MTGEQGSTREKLIQAAQTLLQEREGDPGRITAREITERAGVGLGSINYHFPSKDHLLNEAVVELINRTAEPWLTPAALPEEESLPAREQLERLLQDTARVAARFPRLARLPIGHTLREGSFSVQDLIVPLLREIFPEGTPDLKLKLTALQLITPMQFGFLHADGLRSYAGVDIANPAQREQMIRTMIKNVLPEEDSP